MVKDGSNPKKDNATAIWLSKNIAGIVAVILAVVLLSGFYLRLTTHHGQEISVPDFANLSVPEAEALASKDALVIEVTDSVYNSRMARGTVFSQNPKAGSMVKKGRRILITINSLSPKKVQMPNLVGYSMRQAKAELGSRGLVLGTLEYVEDIATNNVLRQLMGRREIKAGTMVNSGTVINLELGLNEDDNQTFVPNVKGLKYLRAVEAVHDANMNVRRLVFDNGVTDYSDSLDAVVYKQDPEPSEESLLMGSELSLYLRLEKKD